MNGAIPSLALGLSATLLSYCAVVSGRRHFIGYRRRWTYRYGDNVITNRIS
jgi:hypothetical protein